MNKKYNVRLSDEELQACRDVTTKLGWPAAESCTRRYASLVWVRKFGFPNGLW